MQLRDAAFYGLLGLVCVGFLLFIIGTAIYTFVSSGCVVPF